MEPADESCLNEQVHVFSRGDIGVESVPLNGIFWESDETLVTQRISSIESLLQ